MLYVEDTSNSDFGLKLALEFLSQGEYTDAKAAKLAQAFEEFLAEYVEMQNS